MKYTLGFEIEGIWDWSGDVGGYSFEGSTQVSPLWRAGTDASLDESYEDEEAFGCCEPVEFVSEILSSDPKSDKYWKKALTEFKNTLFQGKELNKVANFNDSCGAHIHFAQLPEHKLYKKILFSFEEKLFNNFRTGLIKAVDEGKIPKKIATKILKQYYRSYSAKNNGGTVRLLADFGTTEWRSFNLTGVQTWEQFFTLYEIAIKSVEYFLKLQGKKVVTNIY